MTATNATATNANAPVLAALLAASQGKGTTFTGLIYPCKGEVRGGKVYGDDVCHYIIVAGFSYERLKARDLTVLASLTDAEILEEAKFKGITLTLADVFAARVKVFESATKSAAGTNTATHDDNFERLVVDGEPVKGARIYKCSGHKGCGCSLCNPGDARAPVPGTIYLSGLIIGREVLTPAANGPVPAPNSSPVTIARKLFERRLPSSRFRSFRLPPGLDFILRAGGVAEAEVSASGIKLNEKAVADALAA